MEQNPTTCPSEFFLLLILKTLQFNSQHAYKKLSPPVIYSQNSPVQNSLFAHIQLKLKMAGRLLNSIEYFIRNL